MKYSLIVSILALAFGATAHANEPKAPAQPGYTTEVRYTKAPIAGGKRTVVSKLIITRDASGRIVSVKRG